MKKVFKNKLGFLFALIVMLSFHSTNLALAVPKASVDDDPWGKKEVLNYLLCTRDKKLAQDVNNLQTTLGLTDEQMKKLKEIAIQEHLQVTDQRKIYKNPDI